MEKVIKERLAFLNPLKLEIVDESHFHKGHAGNNGGGHFKIIIQSSLFIDKTRMEKHRLVYGALEDLIPKKIHALSVKIEEHDV